ncbi:uncharacterized protein LOC107964934 isoform X2 [Apis mellifera]|uniref:Uncharacterized protein LOC107964934 isoform X2 n=1 Tax=Apis mellifera TaxID=7460 RepID=A0A7M7SQ99_APIME|nr:uncharacterized protein LOC107964934 isoform X2 [Apis mellifera]|eukprot:XP_026298513.1 uncharacterized protein LOC107964934 isoform X2 [Apis mellifera]
MKFHCLLLCLATIVVCQARRIPRIPQHPYFPNFQQHVYQPRNYPNELLGDQHIGPPFFGNYRTQEGNTGGGNTGREEGVGQDYYDHRIPIDGQPNFLHPFAAVPFDDIHVNNGDFRGRDIDSPHRYERFNHPPNYNNHQL